VARGACSVYAPMPVQEARRRLADLVSMYEEGLAHPLDFFPKTAWELISGGSPGDVRRKWTGTGSWPGERAHPAYVLAWRGIPEPIGEGFEEKARKVFGDLPVTRIPLAALEAAA
jgi:exonuclease V gamma subunit